MHVFATLMALSEAELMVLMPRALFIGIALGGVYDIFRALRRIFSIKLLHIALQDISYFILYGSIVFYNLMSYGKGMVILSVIGSFVAGTILYLLLLSKYALRVLIFTFNILFKTVEIIMFPVIKMLEYFFKKVLQPILKMLYNVSENTKEQIVKGVKKLKNASKLQPSKKHPVKGSQAVRRSISPK